MAKLLTKAKHCLTSIQEDKQYSSRLSSLRTKKPFAEVPSPHSDNLNCNVENSYENIKTKNNYICDMCLVCDNSKLTHSPASSLNASLHSLSSGTVATSSVSNDADEETISCTSTFSSARATNSATCCISSACTKSSESSTAPQVLDMVMSTESSKGTLSSSRSNKKKKRVRFAPPAAAEVAKGGAEAEVQTTVIDYIQPSSTMTETQRNDMYWQLKDYEYFRGTAQIIANEVMKVTATQAPTTHSYNAVMTRVYELCAIHSEKEKLAQQQLQQESQDQEEEQVQDVDTTCIKQSSKVEEELDDGSSTTTTSSSSSISSASIDSRARPSSPPSTDSEMVIPPHLFAALTQWIGAGHSRRGLEKFCVTSHVRTRPMAKAATVQAVLLAQDLLQKLEEEQNTHEQPIKFQIGSNEFPLKNVPPGEVLRLVSERFSKTSRYYGTAIGHADAAAVGNYKHPLKN